MQVNRLGKTFFAEVVDVDLAHLSDEEFRQIKKAHLEHGVLVFRDQRLTPAQHIAFSARFGPLQVHPMAQFNLEDAPQILLVSNDRPWRLHDLVFWDNRRVMHHATEYPENQRRHMHRTTVRGDAPFLIRGQSPN